MRGDRELTFAVMRTKHSRDGFYGGSESDESTTPKKITKTMHMFNRLMNGNALNYERGTHVGERTTSSSGDEEGTANLSPSTPPLYNHRNARRRKGIPHRAPF